MNQSIYTTALDYGHSRIFEGIKYGEVKNHIEREHKNKFDYHSEIAFIKWFIEAFSSTQVKSQNSVGIMITIVKVLRVEYGIELLDVNNYRKHYEAFTNEYKFFITGESDRKLLEFWELNEARTNAKQAFRMALWAIIISLLGVLFSPILEHYFNVFWKPLLRQV